MICTGWTWRPSAAARRFRSAVALLLLALVALPATAERGPGLLLWEVQGAKARHYLMGSVHLLPPTAHPLPQPYRAAYDAAQALVFESDLGALSSPELQAELLAAARADDAGGIKSRLQPDLYLSLQRRAAEIGMPVASCDPFKPWFCALTLELFAVQRVGFEAQYGVDQYFFARAAEDNKPVTWLEPPAMQARFFTSMSPALSAELLAATLDESTDLARDPEELLRLWQTGDLQMLERMVRELRTHYPQLHERLFAERNRAWLPELRKILKSDTPHLVIVGAAHYAGPEGLLALLRKEGFPVQRVGPAAPAQLRDAAQDPRPPATPWMVPVLHVARPEKALAFYQKAFGFEPGLVLRNEKGEVERAQLKHEDSLFVIVREGGPWKQKAPGRQAPPLQFQVYVSDLERRVAQATAAGAELLRPLATDAQGEQSAVLRDAEGYLWRFARQLPVTEPLQPPTP